MKIIFKEDGWYYAIRKNTLVKRLNIGEVDLCNIPHLDDAKVLYHYKSNITGAMLPVYYKYKGMFITRRRNESRIAGKYHCVQFHDDLIKDYTITNLNLL